MFRKNKYRFNYGRQANRTLKELLIPKNVPLEYLDSKINAPIGAPVKKISLDLADVKWKEFRYGDLFDLSTEKFVSILAASKIPGPYPFISTGSVNNGIACYTSIGSAKTYPAGCITVASSGNAGEVFYQDNPFKVTNMVIILNPKFKINKFIGLFLTTLIRAEKYRYSYGRKAGLERIRESKVRLPIDKDGNPDWQFMEDYIKSLPYSASL